VTETTAETVASAELPPEPLALIDTHGHIVALNPQAEQLLGYRGHELRGRPLTWLLTSEASLARSGGPGPPDAGTARLAPGSPITATCRRKDGGVLPIQLVVSPVEPANGVSIAVIRDLGHSIAGKQERLRSHIARVTHDLHNTIGVINNYATFVADDLAGLRAALGDDAATALLTYLSHIQRAVDRATGLIDQLAGDPAHYR
jgi:PAS domain-containing protein